MIVKTELTEMELKVLEWLVVYNGEHMPSHERMTIDMQFMVSTLGILGYVELVLEYVPTEWIGKVAPQHMVVATERGIEYLNSLSPSR